METLWKYATACFILCCFVESTMSLSEDEKAIQNRDALVEGSNKFAINLYQALVKENPNQNLIVSPTSLMMVLSLAYSGAKGQTAKEIKEALGLPNELEDVLTGYNKLIKDLKNPVLKLVNKIFADSTVQLKESFQKNANEYFMSPAQTVDFVTAAEKARTTINAWVEENTNNKIRDLLQPGVVDSSTRLVLTNAIHFKANWFTKFDSTETSKTPFYVSSDTTVEVDMMHTKDKFGFKHHEGLGAKMLELPYEGNDFRMIAILPDENDGLASVESKLHTLNLAQEFSSFRNTTVLVGLPKFKMESTMNLKTILTAMGMGSMFDQADFSEMAENEQLSVSKVVQKAFIEVNEEGTEAAAATAIVMLRMSARPMPIRQETFIADHPYIIALMKKGPVPTTLFLGRYMDPTLL